MDLLGETMRFFQVKKDSIKCRACEGYLSRGEVAVWLSVNMKGGDALYNKFHLIFHPQCFRDWNDRIFLKRYEEFKASLIPRKKIGRPKIYQDGKTVHKLRMLQAYHQKAGHTARVEQLEESIRIWES